MAHRLRGTALASREASATSWGKFHDPIPIDDRGCQAVVFAIGLLSATGVALGHDVGVVTV